MRNALAGLGLAGLLCLPCLLLGGVVGVGLIGGALGALATNPAVQAAGLVIVGLAATLYWRARRRATCEVEGPSTAEHERASGITRANSRSR